MYFNNSNSICTYDEENHEIVLEDKEVLNHCRVAGKENIVNF